MFPLFVEKVLEFARTRADHPALALAHSEDSVTYGVLFEHVAFARKFLTASGVRKGSRIILAADRSFNFIFAYLAIHSLGAVAIPLDPKTPGERIEKIRQATDPVLTLWPNGAVANSINMDCLSGRSSDSRDINIDIESPDALADIMFTSGTTEAPKGVLLSHANLAWAINNINAYIGNGEDDIELCPMPLSHSFGIARIRCNLYSGATIVLEDGVANPRRLFEAMARKRVTGIGMVGPAWMMLRKLSGDKIGQFGKQLKYFELGSAAIDPKAKKALADLLPTTHVCMHYGLTEASRAAFLDFHDDVEVLESVGKASPYCEIAIFSPAGQKLACGEQGEVCVRGPMVCKSYLNPQHNNGAWHSGDFFRTGDLGWLDKDGYLRLTGRIKEMINVGGEKVAPIEIEKILDSFPCVRESACVGLPHPVLGETVAAFIVPEDDCQPDLDSIAAILKERLEPYKVPARYALIKELPRTISGKIRRASLKKSLSRENF